MRAKPYFLTVLVETEEESGLVGDEIFVQVRPGLVRLKTQINQSVLPVQDNQSEQVWYCRFSQMMNQCDSSRVSQLNCKRCEIDGVDDSCS